MGIWLSSGISIYTDLKLSYSDNIDCDDDCDLSNCINKIKLHETKLCNDLDKCRSQEVNGITSKYTIQGNTNKVHWINHNDKFYLNKVGDATLNVTSGNNAILTNVYYCNSDDAKCPAGKYLYGNTCTNCHENSVSAEGSNSVNNCICKAGYEGSNGGSCTACPAGKYKSSDGNTICQDCPANKYSDSTGNVSCSSCPSETYSVAGSKSFSDCAPCSGVNNKKAPWMSDWALQVNLDYRCCRPNNNNTTASRIERVTQYDDKQGFPYIIYRHICS